MLPQILRKSGMRYYCLVRPEERHRILPSSLFWWESPDGSQVMAYRADKVYKAEVPKTIEYFDEKGITDDVMVVFGVTDHGGAPTKQSIADIHREPRATFSTVRGFFEKQTPKHVIREELLTGDFGPYSNYARIKKINRMGEYALLNAERASLIAGKDERGALRSAWHDLLFNQFHDILGGASIKDAYVDAEQQIGRATATANEVMHFSLQSVTRRIATPGKNPDTIWNLVVWNLNGRPYVGPVEAEVQWVHEFPWYDGEILLEDGEGRQIPCQIIREKSVIPRFRSRFLFRAEIPAMGYKAFRVVKVGDRLPKKMPENLYHIHTDRLSVEFSKEDGTIRSVTDQRTGRPLAVNAFRPVSYGDLGDTWCFNIEGYEADGRPFDFEGFQVIESGDRLTVLKGTYRQGKSSLELYYRFYAEESFFDLSYRVNWEDKHRVLKLVTDVAEERHTVATPGCATVREGSPADVPLGAWIRVGDMRIASDGVFAYRMLDRELGLTLLRSPIYGDLRIREIDDTVDYDIIDRGIVEGKLRVGFEGDPWDMADALVNPPIVIDECCHEGDLPAEKSFFGLVGEGAQITALKYAEDGEETVIRVVETDGQNSRVELRVGNREYPLSMKPYEIRTLKLQNGEINETDLLERPINI
jgi:alpha-mannosidase